MLATLESRLIALGATLLVLATLGAWIHHKGVASGRESVQAKFDDYRAKVQAQAAIQTAETKRIEAATAARNEAIHHDYQAQLAAIAADNASISRRLSDYRARVRALSQVPSQPGSANPGPQSSSQTEADRLNDEYDRACREDSAQLNALIEGVKPQLIP